jgi:subtilisin family serine protease
MLAACSDNSQPLAPAPYTTPLASNFPSANSNSAPIPGRYIVVYKTANQTGPTQSGASRVVSMAAHAKYAGRVHEVYNTALHGMAVDLTDAEVTALRADSTVAFIEQDQALTLAGVQTTNVPWNLDRLDQRTMAPNGSYAYATDGSGVTVYMIDTGISFSHSEFGGRAVKGIDIYTPGGTAMDCFGHGTETASVVGGSTFGVAKKVKLVAVRVTSCAGGGSLSTELAGVDWITANRTLPAVANISLINSVSSALNQAVQRSIASGVVYTVGAGNGADDACHHSPGSAAGVITVGATDMYDRLASFSAYGPCVALNAPGVSIPAAYGGGTAKTVMSGTSASAPHVAGAAALYLSAHPTATPAQVKSALVANATKNVLLQMKPGTPNLLLYTGASSTPTPTPPPIKSIPVAKIAATCSATTCSFDASGSTALTNATYAWSFGDGTTGTGRTTSHVYARTGSFAVSLTVKDANGSNTTSQSIVTSATANRAPTASISAPSNGASVVKGTSISFAGNGTDAEDGTLAGASLVWTSSLDGQIGTSASFSSSTLRVGTHTVTLTAKDSKGATGTASRTITVTAAPSSNQAPTARFTWSCATGTPHQCAFDASSSTDNAGIVNYAWNWGNGRAESRTSPLVRNTWTAAGTYNVTLTVTDGGGLKSTFTQAVKVP